MDTNYGGFFMDEHIFFSYDCDKKGVEGNTVLTNDGSMIYEPSFMVGPFSVYPYHWSFEITTQTITSKKYKLRYAMGYLCTENCVETELSIPDALSGQVFLNLNFNPSDGIYYNDFFPFICHKYYDSSKKILAVGDIESEGICIEFAEGQFVVIDAENHLIAVYIVIK